MFMLRKNRMIREQMDEYFQQVKDSLQTFSEAIEYLLQHGIDARFRTYFDDAHSHESKADDIRMAIEVELYKRSLLPESRRDIMVLMECTDRISNRAESILNQIETENVLLPDFIHDDIRELVRVSLETYELVMEAAKRVLGTNESIREWVDQVDHNESVCDKIERKMIREVFKSDLDKADMILVKEVILQMGGISDLCENVGHFLKVFHVKRYV